jgi:hypothetical protein
MSSRPSTETHQLELNLAVEDTDRCARAKSAQRSCPVCGAALDNCRRDALYCGGPCRAEASRVHRLRRGQVVDGYRDLAAYRDRQRRTKLDGAVR